ncbi:MULTISPECIES: FecR domain-containing protein [Bacteroides]|uniref:FecR family protein n=1 Tax=Bacteroides TaxID=816 RepID=UPI0004B8F177|nr:FecR domain-containing protein [Bacteroides neonati]
MTEHIFKDIKEILHRYASNKATVKELRELKEAVNRGDDESLKPILEEEWEQWQTCTPLSISEKDFLFQKIKKQTQPHPMLNRQRYGLRFAASIIIILLTSISVYLYTSNLKMTQLGEQSVIVKVGHGERVSMTLPDGTKVRLNSESELSYQQNFGLTDRQVTLTGEGFFDVSKSEKKKFIVHTRFLNIEVLGTAFNVYTYEKADSAEMALVRGSVLVTAVNAPHQKFYVNPNEKVVYDKKTGNIRIEASCNQVETAWMSNELVFRSALLKDVFNRVGRKYGIIFNIDDRIPMNDRYTGIFDEGNISDVMNILKKNFKFDYRMKEDTIWVNYPPK